MNGRLLFRIHSKHVYIYTYMCGWFSECITIHNLIVWFRMPSKQQPCDDMFIFLYLVYIHIFLCTLDVYAAQGRGYVKGRRLRRRQQPGYQTIYIHVVHISTYNITSYDLCMKISIFIKYCFHCSLFMELNCFEHPRCFYRPWGSMYVWCRK